MSSWISNIIRRSRLKHELASDQKIIDAQVKQIKDSDIVNSIHSQFIKWVEDYFVPQWKENRGKDYHHFFIRVDVTEVAIYESIPDPYGYTTRRGAIFTFNKHGYNDINEQKKRAALKKALCLKSGLDVNGHLDKNYWEPIMNKYCQNFKDVF